MATQRKRTNSRSTKKMSRGGGTPADTGATCYRGGGPSPADVMGNVIDPGPVVESDVGGAFHRSRSMARSLGEELARAWDFIVNNRNGRF